MGGDVESREKVDREPRMHIMADLSKEKFSLHLSQCNVELYGLSCFSVRREASEHSKSWVHAFFSELDKRQK